MRAIVIDDSREVVKLMEEVFKRYGVGEVDKAYDFEEGLSKIEKESYDVYVIDYHLSFGNGLELAKLASKNDEAKVIIITSDSEFKSDDFPVFYKPFSVIELVKFIMGSE